MTIPVSGAEDITKNQSSRKRIGLVCLAGLLAGWPAGAATNWYVATNGTGGAGTNWSTAFTNIQSAINTAAANDTIHLAGHTFGISVQITNVHVSSLTMIGGYAADTNAAELPGTNNPVLWPTTIRRTSGSIRLMLVSNVSDVVLDRLTFYGGCYDSGGSSVGGGLYLYRCTNLSILSCLFLSNAVSHGPGAPVNYGGGIYAVNVTSGLISNSVLMNNYAYGETTMYGGGLYLSGGSWTLRDAVIFGCSGTPSCYGSGAWLGGNGAFKLQNVLVAFNYAGAGVYVSGAATTAAFSNCTFYGNSASYGLALAGGTNTIRNSILFGNLSGDLSGSPGTLENNLIGDGTSNGVSGNFAADPLFEYPLCYLATNSPCIGRGNTDALSAGVTSRTSFTNGFTYADPTNLVNLGYHYPEGLVFDLDLYVSPAGTNTNDGLSWDTPVRTITKALVLAAKRTRIHIAAGTYTTGESFPLTIANNRTVQLLGTNAAATVINAAGSSQRVLYMYDTMGANRCEGLTLQGGNYYSAYGGGLYALRALMTFRNCVVATNIAYRAEDAGTTDMYGGGIYAWSSGILLEGTIISNNNVRGTRYNYGYGGGVCANYGRMLIKDCVFSRNYAAADRSSGAHDTSYGNGGALHIQSSAMVEIRNSLVVTNWCKYGAGISIASGKLILENVTVARQPAGYLYAVYLAGGGPRPSATRSFIIRRPARSMARPRSWPTVVSATGQAAASTATSALTRCSSIPPAAITTCKA